MKRLFSILLMNAWGGLRQKASLSTMSLVAVSVMSLLVLSTVTAGALPHINSIPDVGKVAGIVPAGMSYTPPSSVLGSSTPHKSTPAVTPNPLTTTSTSNASPSTANTSTSANSSTSSGSNTTSSSSTSNQSTLQSTAASLTLSPPACVANQPAASNEYTINIMSAQLGFPTPPTAGGTITYQWETASGIGSNIGQATPVGSPASQTFTAGQANVTIGNGNGQPPLYSTNSSTTSDSSFRLHVTGPIDMTSSWVSMPQSANGSCPQTSN